MINVREEEPGRIQVSWPTDLALRNLAIAGAIIGPTMLYARLGLRPALLRWTLRMHLRLGWPLRMHLRLGWPLRMHLRLGWTLWMRLRLG